VFSLDAMVRDTVSLIAPVECVGCGMPDKSLCGECAVSLRGTAIDVQLAISREFFGRPVRACAPYSGRSRAVVLGFKDHGHHRIAPFLAQSLISLLDPLMSSNPDAVIVPVPSSPRGRLRRGIEPTLVLAQHVKRSRPRWATIGALRPRYTLPNLISPAAKSLTRRERLHRPRQLRLTHDIRNRRVIVLDDVITTGSTLEACARVIREGGGEVIAALALAATPRSGHSAVAQSVNRG